jgi:GGDEF domain-containing protein
VDAAMRRLAAENDRLRREIRALEEALRGALDKAQQLEAIAYRDSLTGLPNRRSLADSFRTMLSTCAAREFAVLFVDLDDFKRINESLGHRIADALLRELAAALDGLIRSVDAHPAVRVTGTAGPQPGGVLSRLGGDEFVILLPEIKDRASAESIAARILEHLERPFQVGSRNIVVTASIGIALYPSDGHTADTLVSNADAAMYAAKRRGKACYEHYRAAPDRGESAADAAPLFCP